MIQDVGILCGFRQAVVIQDVGILCGFGQAVVIQELL